MMAARAILACVALAFATATSAQVDRHAQPEPATGRTPNALAHARTHMVAAAHPLAVAAGLRMLDAGGNAIDAAIATQLVLNLVEPQSSGIGGGAFLLYHDAATGAVRAYDGRESAPAAATPELFLDADGAPLPFRVAVASGRSVGVPGLVRLLEHVHRSHGKLPWRSLFEPAIALADAGFPLSARVQRMLTLTPELTRDTEARSVYFTPQRTPKPIGSNVRNLRYAQTLRTLAEGGADAFYSGPIARDLVAAVRGHPQLPGSMTAQDLANYAVREVPALCGRYRAYRVCGMPPPSSGGIAVLQMLGVLARFDMAAVRPGSAYALHLLAEAGRLAFADRNRYVADDRYVEVPVAGLLDPAYLEVRSALIRLNASMGEAQAGVPPGATLDLAGDPDMRSSGTSHLSIVDRAGNAVALTSTIESAFGSRMMVRGFFLNNQLTDFSFVPHERGRPVANRVEPGKRPRSSMAPTLVFDRDGSLHMVVGSPGGSLIIGYVLKTLVATLDWNLDMQAAIDLPNVASRNGPTEIERDTDYQALAATLAAMGHPVRVMDMTSGVHGILRVEGGWQGGADPRREGVARGR